MKKLLSLALAAMLLLALLPAASLQVRAADADFADLPSGDELRELVVEHSRAQAAVLWTPAETVDFRNACTWSPALYYEKGVTYRGIPYTSDKISVNADVYAFSRFIDETGAYVGPVTWNDMPGSDCGGQVRLSYGWAGVLCGNELEDMIFDPGDYAASFGMMPVGGYDWSGFNRSASSRQSVLEPNGKFVIYNCYAQMQPGDCVFVLYPDGGEHIMLVTGMPNVAFDGRGECSGEQSTVRILEQTSSIHGDGGVQSNWRESDYTFASLYETGFIPLTMEAFNKSSLDAPTFETAGVSVSGKVGRNALLSGQVLSNYNIFRLRAEIQDASGKTVLTGETYPNSLRADLGKLDYAGKLASLPAGSYRYLLTAEIGFGVKTVLDSEIEWAGAEESPVVFIKDGGSGDGSSPEEAMGNLPGADANLLTSYKCCALYRALNMLSETGGTTVICGDSTVASGRSLERHRQLLSPMSAPEYASEQTVLLTSVYGGVDYRAENGAELILERNAKQTTDLELNICSVWRDLDLRFDYNYVALPAITESTMGAFVACGGKKTVIEDSVTVSLSQSGTPLETEEYKKYLPHLFGGYYNLCGVGDTDLTVLGGTWANVCGGSHDGWRYGSCNLTFGGNARAYGGIYGGGDSKKAVVCGDVTVSVTGGTASGKMVAGTSGSFGISNYQVSLKISGWPDLSGITIVNAGTSTGNGMAPLQVLLNMGEFKNAGENFTAYYNESDFSMIVPAPAPEANPNAEKEKASEKGGRTAPAAKGGMSDTMLILVSVGSAVVVAAVVVWLILRKKPEEGAKNPAPEEKKDSPEDKSEG